MDEHKMLKRSLAASFLRGTSGTILLCGLFTHHLPAKGVIKKRKAKLAVLKNSRTFATPFEKGGLFSEFYSEIAPFAAMHIRTTSGKRPPKRARSSAG